MIFCEGASLEIVKQYIVDQKCSNDKTQIKQSKKFTGSKWNKNKNWLA